LFSSSTFEKPNDFFYILIISASIFIIDTSVAYVADFLVDFNTSSWGITLFVSLSVIFTISLYALNRYIKNQTASIRAKSKAIRVLHFSIRIIQYVLLANILFVIVQILTLGQYTTDSLTFATFVSNAISAVLLGWFSYRFTLWFLGNKKSIVMLLYALAFLVLCFSESMTAIGDTYLLTQKDNIITVNSEVSFYDFEEGTFFATYYNYYDYVDITAFMLMLGATAILLYHYSKNIRGLKLAIIIGLPLLSYISGYLDTLNIYDTDTSPDLFSYYIFQSLSTMSAGILFAISFWFVVRSMSDTAVRNFMITTACGFILFYVTNSASVTVSPYPPFGLISLSFLPLATYLILVGIYSSAFSLSQNISLRASIRNLASQNTNLLHNLGISQMDLQIKNMVTKFKDRVLEEERDMKEQTGINSNMEVSEIEDYVKSVIKEIVEHKQKRKMTGD
jgi:hypothetical protein